MLTTNIGASILSIGFGRVFWYNLTRAIREYCSCFYKGSYITPFKLGRCSRGLCLLRVCSSGPGEDKSSKSTLLRYTYNAYIHRYIYIYTHVSVHIRRLCICLYIYAHTCLCAVGSTWEEPKQSHRLRNVTAIRRPTIGHMFLRIPQKHYSTGFCHNIS